MPVMSPLPLGLCRVAFAGLVLALGCGQEVAAPASEDTSAGGSTSSESATAGGQPQSGTTSASGAGGAAAGPPVPVLVLGVSNGAPFTPLHDGDTVRAFVGPQNGIHTYLSFRLTGFPPDATARLRQLVRLVDGDQIVISSFQMVDFTAIEGGTVNELLDLFCLFNSPPGSVDGEEAVLELELIDPGDAALSAAVKRRVYFTEEDE